MPKEQRSDTSLANKALRLIGDRKITNLTDPNGAARSANEFFYSTRNALLEEYDWSFASQRKKLAASAEVPEFGWDFYYDIPPTWLVVREVSNEPTNTSRKQFKVGDYWQVEGRQIGTNFEAPIYVRGTLEVEDAVAFSSLFSELFYHELAVRMGQDRAETVTLARAALQRLEFLREAAERQDAMESSNDRIAESNLSWLNAQSSGYY